MKPARLPCLVLVYTCALTLTLPPAVKAEVIVLTLPEYSSPDSRDLGLTPPFSITYVVGQMTFDLGGQSIAAARLSGTYGNSLADTTAANILYLDGVVVSDTRDYSPTPTGAAYVPWEYSFSDFSILEDGVATLTTEQIAHSNVRLSPTTLTIETVPEPGGLLLYGIGLACSALVAGKKSLPHLGQPA